MTAHVHHVHLFARDLDASVDWYRRHLGGEVMFDGDFGGARNVFMKVGSGRLNFYAQPPRGETTGPIHHVGVRIEGLADLVARMTANGVAFRNPIREFDGWRYVMCEAPDKVLLELFEVDFETMPENLVAFFSD